jgi:hypothetical protein
MYEIHISHKIIKMGIEIFVIKSILNGDVSVFHNKNIATWAATVSLDNLNSQN